MYNKHLHLIPLQQLEWYCKRWNIASQVLPVLDFPLLSLSMDQIHVPFPKQGTFINKLTLFQISLLVCGKTIFLKTSAQHLQKPV
jgi:hypothetical protein